MQPVAGAVTCLLGQLIKRQAAGVENKQYPLGAVLAPSTFPGSLSYS